MVGEAHYNPVPRPPLGPITLEGQYVYLEPLRLGHAEDLMEAGRDPAIWQWMLPRIHTLDGMYDYIEKAIKEEQRGQVFAFTIRLKENGRVVGSMRYRDVDPLHRSLEVGNGWYTPLIWGTAVNQDVHMQLFTHAFETWGAIRITLKTDSQNKRSEAMIRGFGAHYEGTFRSHRIRPDGTVRDSVIYSIIDSEWPQVKERLARKLREKPAPQLPI